MLRRFILWTAILFVAMGGLLEGVLFTQRGESITMAIMVRYNYDDTHDSHLYEPQSKRSLPFATEKVYAYLHDGSLTMDWAADLYEWVEIYGETTANPRSADLVNLLGGEHVSKSHPLAIRPLPDWNGLVYRRYLKVGDRWIGHLFLLDLGTGIERDLFAGSDLSSEDTYFGLIFSPDLKWLYVSAMTIAPDNYGIYRISLADDTIPPAPIWMSETYPISPIIWLDGWLLVEIEQRLWRMRPDGSDASPILPLTRLPFSVSESYEAWLPEAQLLIVSWFQVYSGNSQSGVVGVRLTENGSELVWELLVAGFIGLSPDEQWIILAQKDRIVRIRADDPAIREVLATNVPGIRDAILSPDGQWVGGRHTSNDVIVLVDLTTGTVHEYPVGGSWTTIFPNAWSPDSKSFVYYDGIPGGTPQTWIIHNGESHPLSRFIPIGWVTLD